MYRRTRDIRVTTISTYVDIHFLSVPGLTGYNQGKSSSLYRPPGRVPIHILYVDIPYSSTHIIDNVANINTF